MNLPIQQFQQDRFQLGQIDPASAVAVTSAATQRSSTTFFATAVAAGVTTWILTRILERLFLRKR